MGRDNGSDACRWYGASRLMLGYLASRSVGMAPASLRSPAVDPAEGYALLLLPSIRQHVETTFAGLVGHRRGWWQDHALIAVDVRLTRAAQFWSALAPLPTRPS